MFVFIKTESSTIRYRELTKRESADSKTVFYLFFITDNRLFTVGTYGHDFNRNTKFFFQET